MISLGYLIIFGVALLVCTWTTVEGLPYYTASLELRNYYGRVILPKNTSNGAVIHNEDLQHSPTIYLYPHYYGNNENNYSITLTMEDLNHRSHEVLWMVTNLRLDHNKRLVNGTDLIEYTRPPNVTANFTLTAYNQTRSYPWSQTYISIEVSRVSFVNEFYRQQSLATHYGQAHSQGPISPTRPQHGASGALQYSTTLLVAAGSILAYKYF